MGSNAPADTGATRARLLHESAVFLHALAGGAPALVVALVLLASSDLASKNAWTLAGLLTACWLGSAALLRERVVRPLQSVANLIAAVREGDYSLRARHVRGDGALEEAMREMNLLAATMRERRLEAMEASALLDQVMRAVDIAIFAFDRERRVRLVNPAGARLLAEREHAILGALASTLGLEALLQGDAPRTVETRLPGGDGPFELRRTTFRSRGVPHQLVILGDLRRALREEEQHAWRRLVRVLGHEINNSLGPIQNIATHLHALSSREERPADWEEDLREGLAIVARRSESLGRFLSAYARLARVPRPTLGNVDLGACIRRIAALDTRAPVRVQEGPPVTVLADADQLDQLLINVVRNAVDAALETGGGADVTWRRSDDGAIEIDVLDEGHGIASTENLFVPFFTTKPTGSGIGLVLSRQIAEAHDGTLVLAPRSGRSGCLARLRLPPGSALEGHGKAAFRARSGPLAPGEFESKGRSAGPAGER